MSMPQPLALVGFPPNELSAFSALFRLAARSGPGYVLVAHAHEAEVVVANADDADAVRQLWRAEPAARVLLIGESDVGTGWLVQPRPIQLLAVLEAVRALGASPAPAQRQAAGFAQTVPFEPSTQPVAAYAPQPPALAPSHLRSAFAATEPFAPLEMARAPAEPEASGFQPTQPYASGDELLALRAAFDAAMVAPADAIDRASIALWREARRVNSPSAAPVAAAPAPAPATPALAVAAPMVAPLPDQGEARPPAAGHAGRTSVATAPTGADVLVVDAGDISRHTLENYLRQHGLRANLVRSLAEAVDQLATHSYRLVFVNEPVAGASVFGVCRAVRRRNNADGSRPAIVLVLSNHRAGWRRLRARLAGCNVCLVRPFDEAVLAGVLARFAAPTRGELPAVRA
jgi:CheY-like chemotaxis protein